MRKGFFFGQTNKSGVALLAAILVIGGVSVQAAGVLNTPAGGYLLCINQKSGVVTHPITPRCAKGFKPLIVGAKGEDGAPGLIGATGLPGRDAKDGKNGQDGKTLWNGVKDPESTWGAPGDMFINSVTKTLFGPKNLDGSWPAGVAMVGPAGATGLTGATGVAGPSGPQGPGGSGPAGATGSAGATGAAGAAGASALKITEQSICGAGGTSLCKIGAIGPGGGLIFFVDYNDQYAGFNYLEAAPTDGVFAASLATGVWATTVLACGASSNASCQSNSIYTQTGVALATIKGLHRGLFGGQAATNAIIAKHPGVALDLYAAGVADSYTAPTFNGVTKSDYYLPTKDEIELMQKNLNNVGVGGFVAGDYWSSTENGANYAWYQGFGSGYHSYANKYSTYYVRPVRAF